MKKSLVTALAVALLGAMALGAVASSASVSHKPAKNIVQTAVAAPPSCSARWVLLPVSPILSQTGTERLRWAALPASVEPGLTKAGR